MALDVAFGFVAADKFGDALARHAWQGSVSVHLATMRTAFHDGLSTDRADVGLKQTREPKYKSFGA